MRKKVISGLTSVAIMLTVLFLLSCTNNKVAISTDQVSITVGDSYQLQLSNADSNVKWSSSNEKVATVDETGKVDGKTKGEAAIIALLSNGEKLSCNVTVNNIEVTSVKLDKTTVALIEGNSTQIEAKIYPAVAVDELDWDSTDTSVAVVDDNGFVTAIKKGTAVIRCFTSNGKSASCSVKVTASKSSSKSSKTTSNNTTINNYYNNSSAAHASDSSTLYCRASDWATLREYNSRNAKALAKIKSRESVVYISSTTEFYYVAYQGIRGYVLKDYFSYDPNAPLNYGNN